MQITNPTLSQYIGNTLNRNQQVDRYPVKPVTIEGQLVDDEDNKKRARQVNDDENNKSANGTQLLEESSEQVLIPSVSPQDNVSEALIIQKKLGDSATSFNGFNADDPNQANYAFGSRRSFNGVAGGSLVIQNYLNNEPEKIDQANGLLNRVDYFV